jgi:hypothetical protein
VHLIAHLEALGDQGEDVDRSTRLERVVEHRRDHVADQREPLDRVG